VNGVTFEQLQDLRRGRFGEIDVPCPLCGPDRRSPVNQRREVLRLWCDDPNFISYRCARCDVEGYALDGSTRASDSAVIEQASRRLKKTTGNESRPSEFPRQLWSEAINAVGTLAEKYLASRQLALPDRHNEVLRFHPSCPFGKGSRHPCLVALYRGIKTNEPKAVHRTALTPEGKKLDRKALGPKAGCAIKLTPDEDVTEGLSVAEGIETALAGMALNFRPMWALGDARAVAKFPLLSGIECLTILVDNDASGTGQASALECSRRWTSMGREVFRVVPTVVGHDMADIVGRAA
jgi:Toprim domain